MFDYQMVMAVLVCGGERGSLCRGKWKFPRRKVWVCSGESRSEGRGASFVIEIRVVVDVHDSLFLDKPSGIAERRPPLDPPLFRPPLAPPNLGGEIVTCWELWDGTNGTIGFAMC